MLKAKEILKHHHSFFFYHESLQHHNSWEVHLKQYPADKKKPMNFLKQCDVLDDNV